jgi:hypothetical protein
MIERGYVNKEDCIKNLKDKDIYIFGAGVDGELALKKLSDSLNVIAFIDNKRAGQYFCNKKVYTLNDYLKIKGDKTIILLTSYRFAKEISAQLEENNLRLGKEYLIWDDMRILQGDETCRKYIEFMKGLWEDKKIESDSQVLVACENRHDYETIVDAYIANYLAEKYNASIRGYGCYGVTPKDVSEVIMEIYRSINMKDLIDPVLSDELKEESRKIFERVWEGLYTWADWKNITIYGICFGTTFITDYLREKIPCFDMRDETIKVFIRETIDTIVFWYHYFEDNDVKAVVLSDGVCWEGYIRDIAVSKGIPAYAVQYTMQKAYFNFHDRTPAYQNYKKMWETLSEEEKEYGLKWAEEHLKKRIGGSTQDIDEYNAMNFAFSNKTKEVNVLDNDDKIKIVILPHIFEENSYLCGEQIFDNSYFSWLCHLGELSDKYTQYHWYLKMHPAARRRDPIIINKLLEKYKNIKLIPSDISPLQLKREGVKYALTVQGSIGHEYPAIGIEVINAGMNPHSAFDFTWNPKTKEEYDDIIANLDKLPPKNNMEELLQFYAMHYLYYDREYIKWEKIFFDNPFIPMYRERLEAYGKEYGTWKYDEYMKEWTQEKHKKLLDLVPQIVKKMDEWNEYTFYRRTENLL